MQQYTLQLRLLNVTASTIKLQSVLMEQDRQLKNSQEKISLELLPIQLKSELTFF